MSALIVNDFPPIDPDCVQHGTNPSDGACICTEEEPPVTNPDLTRCGSPDHHPDSDPAPVVVICDHVPDPAYASAEDKEAIGVTINALTSPVEHLCPDPECPTTALCSDCWTDL